MNVRRIGYILKVFPKISETFIVNELVELRRRGVDVFIYSMTEPSEDLQHAIVKQSGLLDRTTYSEAVFRQWISEYRPQLLHAHFATEATSLAARLSHELGIPYSFTAHGYDIYRKPPANFATLAQDALSVIAVSDANATYMSQSFGIPRESIQVIPCGIDVRHFHPAERTPRTPEIVCVARLVPVKNLQLLVNACSILRDLDFSFHCSILGEGRCREELTQSIQDLELQRHVSLEGAKDQTEIAAWWRRASIGVLSSISEGMPVSLMEAAASGVPVVATNVGGIAELVDDDVTGLLVPPFEPMVMADAIGYLLRHPDEATKMGAAARRRALSRFSVQHQVDSLILAWESRSSVLTGVGPCKA